ncbi:MAG TPA: MBL fold metallo-hydrolase [Vicinamibacterales bacterium]|nr:MBL fold metallo-hydrolase [Vicinamibacterales bacterium]
MLSRRSVLQGIAAVVGVTPFGAFAQPPAAGTRLVLLGTQGGPNYTATRGEAANAVLVDGQPYLVDCGYGALAALKKAGVNHRQIAQVFITHLHDDHTADLAALLIRQWTDGRVQPTTVTGPYGTAKMVEAVIAFGEANAAIRMVDEARSVKPAEMFKGRDIAATPAPAEVYRDERLTVRAVENTHFPDESKQKMPYRSVAYRFDARGRSIVVSGDTGYSTGLVALAKGADVLVCEAMDVAAMRKAFEGMVARGMYADNPEGVWRHIVATHTSLEVAGRMAAEAGVRTLVLTHVIPGALDPLPDETYLAPARKAFRGEVVLGRDQLTL